MLVQDPYTGEWVEEKLLEETPDERPAADSLLGGSYVGPRKGRMTEKGMIQKAILDSYNAPPPRPQLLGDDTYDDTPVSSGEAIGYGDRLIMRKSGEEEFTTLGGNIPMPDYFKSGGYRSRPDDPHGDSDVIYYPNEVHTKNKEGGWDIAQRNAPPKPPSEDELSTFGEVSAFRDFHLKEVDAKAKAVSEEVLAVRKKNRSITTDALMKPYQLAARDAADAAAAKSAYDSVFNPGRAEVNAYIGKKSAQLIEEKKNLREKAEEEARYTRALADRERIAAEKAVEKASSDAEKKLERDIKAAEGRSVDIKWLDKRLIEVNEKAKAEGFEPDANSMQALNDIAAKNGKRIEKWQGKKGGYSTLFGDIGREEYAFYALVDKNAPKGQQPQAEPASVQSSVKAGEVRKGYKFKGGNPADRNNWEKI